MVVQKVCLRKANDWLLTIFYCPAPQDTDDVLDALFRAGCKGKHIHRAQCVLQSGGYNTGMTYTNPVSRETVMVIGRATSAEQFVNTFSHEKWHCCVGIVRALGLSIEEEPAAYLVGDISGEIFNNALHTVHELTRCMERQMTLRSLEHK